MRDIKLSVSSRACPSDSSGLLVGASVNLAPELFCAALAGVPFVDTMVTMCDPSIPLTVEEWQEWGNPNEALFFDYMKSYSPMNNVQHGATYPAMLILGGLNDPYVWRDRVPIERAIPLHRSSGTGMADTRRSSDSHSRRRVAYWEPAKWAQVLRATVANGDDILLKIDLTAGHFSAADRYRYLREMSFQFAWLIDQLGVRASPTACEALRDCLVSDSVTATPVASDSTVE